MARKLLIASLLCLCLPLSAQIVADRVRTASFTAANQSRTVAIEGRQSVGFVLSGTWSATLRADLSSDNGKTWETSVDIYDVSAKTVSNTVTANGTYTLAKVGGMSHARIFVVSYTSGIILLNLRASVGLSIEGGRGNEEITVLSSAAQTATVSVDESNPDNKGIYLVVDVTVDPASASITPSILVTDPVSDKDVTIWTAATAITAVGTTSYLLYPGIVSSDFDGTEAVSLAIPKSWVFRMTHADSDSITYSVGVSYIQ